MRIAILPDVHLCYKDGLHPFYYYVTRHVLPRLDVDVILILGDFIDFSYISKFSNGHWGLIEGYRLADEFDFVNLELDELKKSNSHIIWLEGNHEHRVVDLLNDQPLLKGTMEIEKQCRLEEREIDYISRLDQPIRFGNMAFLHGEYASKFHVRKHLESYFESVCYGHVHKEQSEAIVLPGQNTTIFVQSLGCMCDLNPDYLKGRPSQWTLGFGIADIINDHVQIMPIHAHEGTFVFEGKEWRYE